MKRLKYYLLRMNSAGRTNYNDIYEGEMIKPQSYELLDNGRSKTIAEERLYDSTYWHDDIGINISMVNKQSSDLPAAAIQIPVEKLLFDDNGEMLLKRLKNILLHIEQKNTTFSGIYEGPMLIFPPDNSPPYQDYDNTYYQDDIGYIFERTHKLAHDKPTVTLSVSAERLGLSAAAERSAFTKAAADFCLRAFKPYIDGLNEELYNRSRPDKENGKFYLYSPGGEVLVRNSSYFKLCPRKGYENGSGNTVYLLPDGEAGPPRMCLCIMLQIQLPYKKIRKAIQMLCRSLPDAVERFIEGFDRHKLASALELAEKQTAIREWLKTSNYCAFIANGSMLPRKKGTELPMDNAVPFKSVPEDEIVVANVAGMGIKRGVIIITGGGYSGKSTLLDAISAGIYDHYEGDGRELVITDSTAVKISSEDGRSVRNMNISPFIKWIPGGDTEDFSTAHASGSTSQAANIMEAVNSGSGLLLIDEDKSATNFMIRDKMMKELIEREPITPFTDRVNELYEANGVSTILVIGGSGEYLSVADKVYMMTDFHISDATQRAKAICAKNGVLNDCPPAARWKRKRILSREGFTSFPEGCGSERLEISDLSFILIGSERIDIRLLHNIVSAAQLNAIGFILRHLERTNEQAEIDIENQVSRLLNKLEKEGLDSVFSSYFTTCEHLMDMPRKFEILAVINRMRKIHFLTKD